MKSLIVGKGEVGSALEKILKSAYPVFARDKEEPINYGDITGKFEILHICIPWSFHFSNIVVRYINTYRPEYTVIHSTVKVGVSRGLKATHSPVRGKHPDMINEMKAYVKYLSGPDAKKLAPYFEKVGFKVKTYEQQETTELGKILSLVRYAVYCAFAKEQEDICARYDVNYHDVVTEFEKTRNEGLEGLGKSSLRQPVLYPPKDGFGGHCVYETVSMFRQQYGSSFMDNVLRIGKKKDDKDSVL